jgi:hypothetical protein
MRKTLKIFHTLATCGVIGALGGAMVLMAWAPQETPQAYADMRLSVAALGNYILLPSLGLVLFSGFVAMAVHTPYLNKGWALVKAAFGIIMFKGILHVIGAFDDHATQISEAVATGTLRPEAMNGALPYEWVMLWTMMALSVGNVVLGVWRPKFERKKKAAKTARPARASAANDARPVPAAAE